MTATADVCAIGKVNDGTLRVCCSTHQHVLCAHHYARTHFVETDPSWSGPTCVDRLTEGPKVVDLMAALEASLNAAKNRNRT